MRYQYRYILDKSSKKYICPQCGKKSFVRYIDTKTRRLLPVKYGRCDRETSCAYHRNPYKDGYGKKDDYSMPTLTAVTSARTVVPTKYIPVDILKKTLVGYDQNAFIQNLLYHIPFPFKEKDIERVIGLYYLGSIISGYRKSAITFPYIDIAGNVRTIQVKQFNKANHTTGTDFLHSIIEKQHKQNNESLPEWLTEYQKNEKVVTCLFGEHLLKKYQYNPVALVEAPKSAIYGTLYFGFPDTTENLLWLAVYNVSSLTFKKCQVLKGRRVFLFPDLSNDGKAFDLWSRKAKEFSEKLLGTFFKVSDLLEKEAGETERLNGFDLADFLIKQDWRRFRKQPAKTGQSLHLSEKGEKSEPCKKTFFYYDDLQIHRPIRISNIDTKLIFPFIDLNRELQN